MVDVSKVKRFYQAHPIDLSFLTFCSWRQFRFLLPNGRFWKLPRQIHNSHTFNNWVLRKKPLDVYYSTSGWLAPENVGARSEIFSQNNFMFSDLVFDIDGEGSKIKHIEAARKESLKLLQFLGTIDLIPKYIAFSGSKGFHVVCNDPVKQKIASPLERENYAKKISTEIANYVLNQKIKIDSRVTGDTRRILRVPGTINSKSGLCCRLISTGELTSSHAKEIVKRSPSIPLSALEIPKGDDQSISLIRKILGLHRFRARSNPTPFYYASFLSNRVTSSKLFVPIIEFRKTNELKILTEISTLMSTYDLSDAFLFRGESYFAIFPFPFQRSRVVKILKAANSINLAGFQKYHQTFTRISAKVDMNFEIISQKPIFVKHIKNKIPPKIVSSSHQKFLMDTGIQFEKFSRVLGSEEYIVRHSIIEN